MNSIGFPISHKENEKRRVILPEDIKKMKHSEYLYFENGYGEVLGVSDEEYEAAGAHICSRKEVLSKEVVCDPKCGDAEYLEDLKENTILFGWIHATQNRYITDHFINRKLTGYAWEKMFTDRHVFYKNNQLAGEAAVVHAFLLYGRMPRGLNVAVNGCGNTGTGAARTLKLLGANVTQYDKEDEAQFKKDLPKYDAIVNCILWDVTRKDHIIYKEDLKRMKKNALIIDVSCDRHGGIETSEPTTIDNPTYVVDGITHYVVDHTPSLLFKQFTSDCSEVIYPYLDELITGEVSECLKKALIIKSGLIIDQEINKFQNR